MTAAFLPSEDSPLTKWVPRAAGLQSRWSRRDMSHTWAG